MTLRLISILVLTNGLLCAGTTAHGQERGDAIVSVAVLDAHTDKPIHARILVNPEQGQEGCRVDHQEPFRIGTSHCYIVPGELSIHVPPGPVSLQLFRGLE